MNTYYNKNSKIGWNVLYHVFPQLRDTPKQQLEWVQDEFTGKQYREELPQGANYIHFGSTYKTDLATMRRVIRQNKSLAYINPDEEEFIMISNREVMFTTAKGSTSNLLFRYVTLLSEGERPPAPNYSDRMKEIIDAIWSRFEYDADLIQESEHTRIYANEVYQDKIELIKNIFTPVEITNEYLQANPYEVNTPNHIIYNNGFKNLFVEMIRPFKMYELDDYKHLNQDKERDVFISLVNQYCIPKNIQFSIEPDFITEVIDAPDYMFGDEVQFEDTVYQEGINEQEIQTATPKSDWKKVFLSLNFVLNELAVNG